jgi:hypothetical protein
MIAQNSRPRRVMGYGFTDKKRDTADALKKKSDDLWGRT